MKKLRIAQVSTIWETTPPKLYGGTERVVYDLTEELIRRGHDVTLFATGDSKTSAKLHSTYPRAAYRDNVAWENFLYPLDHMAHVFNKHEEFDLIHIHLNRSQDYIALVLAGMIKTPTVFTLHFLLPEKNDKSRQDRLIFLNKHKDKNFISISNAQRTIDLNYAATVYNGLNFKGFKPTKKVGKNLVWIGRFCHEKGPKEAIEVAKRTGMNLILAGKIDPFKKEYFDYYQNEILPQIDGKQIKYIGEVNDTQKIKLLQKAYALINPINWNEPFGLVNIEAMAMGVPVIAFDKGPMKEVIIDKGTGFVVRNVDQMVEAVGKVDTLNRSLIAQYAESHFSAISMTDSYLKVYEKILDNVRISKNTNFMPLSLDEKIKK